MRALAAAFVLAAVAFAGPDAQAQVRPQIYDVKFGTPVEALPTAEWVDPACGTNGGPRRQLIGSFTNFKQCTKEPETGLYEIWFSNDDENELLARATHDAATTQRYMANIAFSVPAVFSLLIDEEGKVQGYRLISDTRAAPVIRVLAFQMARPFKALSRLDEASCTDIPPLPGERRVEGEFAGPLTKQFCQQTTDGKRVTIESRYFLKPGQNLIDPFTQQPHPNAFESYARLEIVNAAALPRP